MRRPRTSAEVVAPTVTMGVAIAIAGCGGTAAEAPREQTWPRGPAHAAPVQTVDLSASPPVATTDIAQVAPEEPAAPPTPDAGARGKNEIAEGATDGSESAIGDEWGGAGRGEAFGLGSIGTLGHGAGTGTGQGFGSGHGRLAGTHGREPPRLRMGATQISSGLPPEVVQRIVRQSFGRFRLCYEYGLRRNPNLQGRVSTKFVIGGDGSVRSVANGGSDLPDTDVVSCVVQAFSKLAFPAPQGGKDVVVVFPIVMSPGGERLDAPPPASSVKPKPPAAPPSP